MTSRRASTVAAGLVLAVLSSCGGDPPSMLDPSGPEARRIAGVWWLMFVLAAGVYVVVGGLIVAAVLRGRRGSATGRAPGDDTFVWLGGVAAPVAILAVLAVVTVTTTQALRAEGDGGEVLRIDVVGERWWWDVTYPDSGVRTANEIHIPVGRPIDFVLSSDNVIHSFWVPELAGKVDTVPGQVNRLRVTADAPGVYRGECAEYCGIQHARMAFLVIAEPPVDFERWLARRTGDTARTPSSETAAQGQRIFMRESCAGCHAIRGTQANSRIGPDLSDFGSRRWIGSITVPNTPENLANWIDDPQSIKPGSLMPPIPLSPADREAIVAYLESLD